MESFSFVVLGKSFLFATLLDVMITQVLRFRETPPLSDFF